MTSLNVVAAFGLESYFAKGCDVRAQVKDLFTRAREVVSREREINLEVVLLIAALEKQNAAVNLSMWGGKRELAQALGLSIDKYLKRAQAGRVLWQFPEFIDLIRTGKTSVSHVGVLASKITPANKDIFLEEIVGKTEREVRTLAASVRKDGSRNEGYDMTFDLRLTITKKQLETLERVKEILSSRGGLPSDEEAIFHILENWAEKEDPIKKAERAEARKVRRPAVPHKLETAAVPHEGLKVLSSTTKPSRSIPAAVMHAVVRRDQGCCSFVLTDGNRCGSRVGLQYDHRVPIAHGGGNDIENVRLLCREHNISEAIRILGLQVMRPYLESKMHP